MIAPRDHFLASLLEATPDAYARAAASALSQRADADDDGGFSIWRLAMDPWIRSLAAALRAGRPELLASHARWLRAAAEARGQDGDFLTKGLDALESALQQNLPEGSSEAIRVHLEAARKELSEEARFPDSALDSTPLAKDVSAFLECLVQGDARGAVRCVRAAQDRGESPRSLILQLLIPAEREIGRLWHRDDMSIAEEHFGTRTVGRALGELLAHADLPATTRGTVVLGGTSSDHHDLALTLLAGLFELEGWRAVDLGSNLPALEFAVAAERLQADVAVLSVSLPTQLELAREAVEALRERCEAKLVIGGYAFMDEPELWRDLGADGFAENLEQALLVAQRWRP